MPLKNYNWDEIAGRWASQMGSANAMAKYKAGAMAMTVSPTHLAAAPEAEQRFLSGIQDSVSSGRRRNALMSVDLGTIQQAMIAGANNLGAGAQRKKAKYAAKMQKFTPVYAQIQSQLASMPKGGESNAVARAAVAIHALMVAAGKA